METYMLSIATALITFGVYRLLGKFMPAKTANYTTEKSFEMLKFKYMNFDLKYLGILVVMIIVFTYSFYQLFTSFVNFRTSMLSDVLILLKPDMITLLLPAFFCAILISSLIIVILTKKELKDDWGEYMAYTNLKFRFNYAKASVYIIKIFEVITVIITIASLDLFTCFGLREIKINGLLSFGIKTYNYSSISNINFIFLFL